MPHVHTTHTYMLHVRLYATCYTSHLALRELRIMQNEVLECMRTESMGLVEWFFKRMMLAYMTLKMMSELDVLPAENTVDVWHDELFTWWKVFLLWNWKGVYDEIGARYPWLNVMWSYWQRHVRWNVNRLCDDSAMCMMKCEMTNCAIDGFCYCSQCNYRQDYVITQPTNNHYCWPLHFIQMQTIYKRIYKGIESGWVYSISTLIGILTAEEKRNSNLIRLFWYAANGVVFSLYVYIAKPFLNSS